jgi:hypothetical protein
MNDVQFEQAGIRAVQPSTVAGDQSPTRLNHTFSSGAVALGAFALGATAVGAIAIGAFAIGRLAIGAFALKRGRIRTLTVENLEVRRLHIGESITDSRLPR